MRDKEPNPDRSFVQTHEGAEVANQIGARRFIECSALTGENVTEVFENATRAALFVTPAGSTESGGCCIVL